MKDRNSTRAEQLLKGAYALTTVEDHLDYYRDFADIYDDQFARDMGYVYPQMLAMTFLRHATEDDQPIADVGCGTGLVAAHLNLPSSTIDGLDLSQDMLDVAKTKSLYRSLHQADINNLPDSLQGRYSGIVSAGTFTFGHLGPESIVSLLELGSKNALHCIGVNTEHYKQQGFTSVFKQLTDNGQIAEPVFEQQAIFNKSLIEHNEGEHNKGEHADDVATIVVYRQLA